MAIIDILTNRVVITLVMSWFLCQLIKFVIFFIRNRSLNFHTLYNAGGMPSSHMALAMALATSVYLTEGFSMLFIATGTMTVYVMHDALVVRRETEKHAIVLNDIVWDIKKGKIGEHTLREILGHTPAQVVVGAIIGVALAVMLV